MKRLGLIGVGAWARRYLDTVGRRQDCRFVAYSRASGGSSDLLPDAEPLATWHGLLDRARAGALDGIVVATSPPNQAEVATALVAAGVPGLVEKPLGMARTDAAAVLARLRQTARKAPLLVNHVHLWAPAFRALQAAVLESGGPAQVATIEGQGHSRGPFRGWSSLNDYAPHDLALCLALVGPAAPFQLQSARRVPSALDPAGELFEADFQLAGAQVRLRVGNGAADKRRRLAVQLRGGRLLVYDDLLPHPGKLLADGQPVPISTTMPLDAVVSDFLQQIDDWEAGVFQEQTVIASLELGDRIAAIIDDIAAATSS